MLSKNFIFTALFFAAIVFCLSCLGKKNNTEQKQLHPILPTDSSGFSISLDGIETIKTPSFDFDGKWKLIENTAQQPISSYLTFEGRKIFSSSTLNYSMLQKSVPKNKYTTFAIYDKCPNENGSYNKNGHFLVIGSGDKKRTCYEVISFQPTKMTLYDIAKNDKLKFEKIK